VTQSDVRTDFQSPTIHAKFSTLACGSLALLLLAIGGFISPGSSGRVGYVVQTVGGVLLAVALIVHIRYLAGRNAVVSGILAAVAYPCVFIPYAVDPALISEPGWANWANSWWGASFLLAAVSLGLTALAKEAELLAAGARAYPPCQIGCGCAPIIHASFLSLGTAALGSLLQAISFFGLIGGGGLNARLIFILGTVGPILIALGIVAHIAHLSARLGRAAVVLGIAGAAMVGVCNIPGISDPAGAGELGTELMWILWAAGMFLGGLSLALVAIRKRSQPQSD
jgi:hypothetical protein